MTKRWSSTRSDLTKTKRQASKDARARHKYNPEMVERLLRLEKLPPDPDAPEDPDELMKWLNEEPPYDKPR